MADEEKTILIDVDVQSKDFDEAIGEVNKELKENREQIKELSKDYDGNSKEIAQLELKNKKLSASKRELSKESDIQSNSLNALRLQLANQVKERNNLNISTEEGKKRFTELNESIKGLNEQISGFEEAGGDFRRNVGNYPNLLGEAAGGITVFGTSLSDVFKLIVANPIGLIIAALTSLIAVFAKSQSGMEFFRVAGAALNTTLAKLADLVEALGVALIEAFESPQKTLDELVENIKDGIFRYFTEFIPNAINTTLEGFGLLGEAVKKVFAGDFDEALEIAKEGSVKLLDGLTDLNPVTALLKKGIDAAIPAFKEFSAEVLKAAKGASELETRLIANEKAQADLEVSRAKSIKQLKELNLIIEDTTKSDEERLAAADAAAQIEEDLLARRLKLKEEELEIIKEQNALANSTEEDIQRRRDAEIEFYNIEAESLERSTTLQNKRNTLLNAQRAKEEKERKADAARIKKEDAEAKKRSLERTKLENDERIRGRQVAEQGLRDLAAHLDAETAAGKVAALSLIIIDSARAVSAAIAAGAGLPFPANLGAIATGVSAVLSGILSAKSILSGASGGGSISPPSVSNINGAQSLTNDSLSSSFSAQATQNRDTSDIILEAIANLPPSRVAVTDINDAQTDRRAVVDGAIL